MSKREHIINTALELFAAKGFEGTSVRDIAEKASVNLAMVSYYFGSKEKLFEALVEEKAGYIIEILQDLVNDKTKSEIEKVDILIEAYVNRLLSNNNFHKVLHQELLMQQRKNLHEHIINIFLKNAYNIKSIIEQGIKRKVFRKVDPELTMLSILGTINQVLLSKTMCNVLMKCEQSFDPCTDTNFHKRLISHLKQMMHSHLLINN